MFVGCSEISVNVIVKQKQHVEITWPLCLPEGYLPLVCLLLSFLFMSSDYLGHRFFSS